MSPSSWSPSAHSPFAGPQTLLLPLLHLLGEVRSQTFTITPVQPGDMLKECRREKAWKARSFSSWILLFSWRFPLPDDLYSPRCSVPFHVERCPRGAPIFLDEEKGSSDVSPRDGRVPHLIGVSLLNVDLEF